MGLVITTGGPESSYQTDGYNRFSMTEFLRPLEQTSTLCGMEYVKPLIFQGVGAWESSSKDLTENIQKQYQIWLQQFSKPNQSPTKAEYL